MAGVLSLGLARHSAREIGDDLKLTPKAVRQAKYRVLVRLREELDLDY